MQKCRPRHRANRVAASPGRLREEIATIEKRLQQLGPDGDCGYENAMIGSTSSSWECVASCSTPANSRHRVPAIAAHAPPFSPTGSACKNHCMDSLRRTPIFQRHVLLVAAPRSAAACRSEHRDRR